MTKAILTLIQIMTTIDYQPPLPKRLPGRTRRCAVTMLILQRHIIIIINDNNHTIKQPEMDFSVKCK